MLLKVSLVQNKYAGLRCWARLPGEMWHFPSSRYLQYSPLCIPGAERPLWSTGAEFKRVFAIMKCWNRAEINLLTYLVSKARLRIQIHHYSML